MAKKILHIASSSIFIPSFIELVKNNFDFSEHDFLLTTGIAEKELSFKPNVYLAKTSKLGKVQFYLKAIVKMHKADKVILHSLYDDKMIAILFSMPWLLKKCYWVMWGGDFYICQSHINSWKARLKYFFRRVVIKNMGQLVTYIEGDVELVRKWYGAKGKYHECLMYSSNLYKEYKIFENSSNTINIQVGNSADPGNNHIEILEKLLRYKNEDICIFAPLSYGNPSHAQEIIKQGKEWFGDKFIPLIEVMSLEDYLMFLGSIDIAIFNHKRQQAMGNTITLLGLGKVVYIRSNTSQWKFFKEKGIAVFDIDELDILEQKSIQKNLDKIKNYFSKENLKSQCNNIFNTK